jgi:hypothetical protein
VFLIVIFTIIVIAMIAGQNDTKTVAQPSPAPVSTPVVAPTATKPEDVAAKSQFKAQIAARQNTARRDYADQLEQSLLSRGLDAHVTVVGQEKDTLRISWVAMSRPVVYNMINSDGMQSQVPSLGFKKVIMTDDGSFSGTSKESWTYHWDGQQWRQ